MSKRKEIKESSEPETHRVRLPGFLTEKEIGLGDVIKRATSAVGSPAPDANAALPRAKPLVGFYQMALVANQSK